MDPLAQTPGSAPQPTTRECLQRLHTGQLQGREHFVARIMPRLLLQVRQQMRASHREQAESLDITHDLLLDFLRCGVAFYVNDSEVLGRYLARCVQNRLRDVFKGLRRTPKPVDFGEVVLDLVAGTDHSAPGESASRNEDRAWMHVAVEHLPTRARQLVLLREFDSASWEVAGEAVGLSPDAARMAHKRALEKLGEMVVVLRARGLVGLEAFLVGRQGR